MIEIYASLKYENICLRSGMVTCRKKITIIRSFNFFKNTPPITSTFYMTVPSKITFLKKQYQPPFKPDNHLKISKFAVCTCLRIFKLNIPSHYYIFIFVIYIIYIYIRYLYYIFIFVIYIIYIIFVIYIIYIRYLYYLY